MPKRRCDAPVRGTWPNRRRCARRGLHRERGRRFCWLHRDAVRARRLAIRFCGPWVLAALVLGAGILPAGGKAGHGGSWKVYGQVLQASGWSREVPKAQAIQRAAQRARTGKTAKIRLQRRYTFWGEASYYNGDGHSGACGYGLDGLYAAHKTLPCGTWVEVRNPANGKRVVVRIEDRGPYIDGRVIDLSDEAFARIASLSAGVTHVHARTRGKP